jgi:hypothetical protein
MARKLTERQQKFIDALFAEANGNIEDTSRIFRGCNVNAT